MMAIYPTNNQMLIKAIHIAVTGLSFVLSILPPSSSQTVTKSKDKIKAEGRFVDSKIAPYILIVLTLIETSVYLVIMCLGKLGYVRHTAAIHQLSMLDFWHVATCLVALAGMALRRSAFRTLDRFFTYQLTIRPKHRLVQDGPYRLLLHPSYTGAVVNCTAVHMMLWYKGLWDAAAYCMSSWIGVNLTSLLGINVGALVAILHGLFMAQMFLRRYKKEEKMLQVHFGQEWDEYASKRWRFVPFIY